MNDDKYPESDLTEKIIAAAIEVHRILGPGFNEDVYEEAFTHELKMRNIPFARQKEYPVLYKSIVAKTFRPDFVVDNRLIVELKAVSKLLPIFEAQILSYLKAANLQIGLLINFNVCLLKDGIKRLINPNVK